MGFWCLPWARATAPGVANTATLTIHRMRTVATPDKKVYGNPREYAPQTPSRQDAWSPLLACSPGQRLRSLLTRAPLLLQNADSVQPAECAVRRRGGGEKWVATFVLATGEAAKPTRIAVDGHHVTMVLLVHEGVELTVDLTFDGDRVAGTWRTESMEGKLTGTRAKDPGRGGGF